MPPPPPSYSQATNYGYQNSPQQAAAARTERAQLLGRVGDAGYPPQNQYPPPASSYPPPQSGYASPAQDTAYPPAQGGYAPPPTGYPQASYPQSGGYPQGYNNPQQGYGQPQPGFAPPPQPYTAPPTAGANAPSAAESGMAGQPKPAHPWEDTEFAGKSFSDRAIRMAFIRKVYMILMVQLTFTFGIVLFFSLHEPTKLWVRQHSWIYWPSYAVFLVTYIILVCCPSVRRKWPVNFICLIIFTCALTYMAGMISSTYSTQSVAVAIGITAGVTLAISIFACQTKWDFTKCGGILFAGCIALLLFGLVCTIWYITMGYSRILQCVYGGLAALLFSMFLAYDTQMLIGGKKYELSPEDHVFGALQLYLDIVYLFLIILSLFGSSD